MAELSKAGARLETYRKKSGKTVTQIAVELGCMEITVRSWLHGIRAPERGMYRDRVEALLKKSGI